MKNTVGDSGFLIKDHFHSFRYTIKNVINDV